MHWSAYKEVCGGLHPFGPFRVKLEFEVFCVVSLKKQQSDERVLHSAGGFIAAVKLVVMICCRTTQLTGKVFDSGSLLQVRTRV